jgi:hypothetical protein
MLRDGLDAFVEGDVSRAERVLRAHDIADDLHASDFARHGVGGRYRTVLRLHNA